MTEIDMQAVRDRLDREEEQRREERQVLKRDYKNQALLLDSFALSRLVNRLALAPSLAWLIYAFCVSSSSSAADIFVYGSISLGLVYYGAPYLSSVAAYFWFRDSNVSPQFAAAAFTLLLDIAYFGWAIFLTS
ncbi:MAG: hypothetical protein E6Q76_11765 [Rhizobium sp.]|nr:MAG: hypothetical protein E6Q76_11765 [Rhizobium sp.]